jgi:hypothetical protein
LLQIILQISENLGAFFNVMIRTDNSDVSNLGCSGCFSFRLIDRHVAFHSVPFIIIIIIITIIIIIIFNLTHYSLQGLLFAIWVRRSKFRHQASPRVSPRERTQRRKVELWARNVRKFCLNADFYGTFRDLLHAVKLRHGTDGFTSPPKEGVLRIFSP